MRSGPESILAAGPNQRDADDFSIDINATDDKEVLAVAATNPDGESPSECFST
jgi:hypothetical protein